MGELRQSEVGEQSEAGERGSQLPATASRMPPLPRPSLGRRVLGAFGWSLLALLVLLFSTVASVVYHASLEEARSLARTTIEDLASDALRGELGIGRVDELGLGRARFTDVVLHDDQGRLVISIPELTVWPDLGRLFEDRTIRIARAHARRPFVRLYTVDDIGGPDPDGLEVSLVRAFLPAHPGEPGGAPLHVQLDGLRLEQATVFGDAPRFPGLRVEQLDVEGRIDIEEQVRIDVFDAHGVMTAPYGGHTEIDRVVLRFSTDWEQGLDAYAIAHREGSRVAARVRVTRPDGDDAPPHVWLRAHLDPLEAQTLTAMGFPGTSALIGRVHGHAVLEGPSDRLALLAYLDTDAGPVRVDGTLESAGRYRFGVETAGAQLDALVRRVPSMLVAGRAEIELGHTGAEPAPPRVRVDLSPLEIAGWAVPALRGEGTLGEDALEIESLSAPDLTAGAGGTIWGRGRVGYDGAIDLALALDVDDVGRDRNVRRLVPGARGAVRGSFHVRSGPLAEALSYDFDLDVRDFRYGPVSARRLLARGFLRGDPAHPVVRVATSGQGLRASSLALGTFHGTLHGGPSHYDVELDVRGGSPVRAARVVGSARRVGGGAFELETSAFEIDPGLGRFRQVHPIRLRASAAGVQFDALALMGERRGEAAPPEVSVAGAVGPARADALRVEVRNFPLERLASDAVDTIASLRGRLQGTLTVDGPLDAPRTSLTGTIEDLSLDRIRTADVTYAVGHEDGTLRVRVDGVLGDRGTILLEGPIAVPFDALLDRERFAEEARFDHLRLAIDQVGVSFLLPFAGIEPTSFGVSGKVSVSGELEGTLGDPRIPSFVVILDRIGFEGWTPLRAKLELTLRGPRLRIRRAWLADVDGELALAQGELVLPLEDLPEDRAGWIQAISREHWSLAVRLEPRLLEQWPRPFSKTLPRGVRMAGTLSASGGPVGASVALDASLRWEEGSFEGSACARREQPVVQIHARTVRDDIAALESSELGTTTTVTAGMFADGRRIAFATATASTPIDAWLARGELPPIPETLVTVALEELPLGRLPWTCARSAGRASGTASLTLFSRTPALRAEIEVEELRIRDQDAQAASRPYHLSLVSRTEGADWTSLAACAVITEEDHDRTPPSRCPLGFLDVARDGSVASFDRALAASVVPLEGEALVRASVPVRFTATSPVPEVAVDRALLLQGRFSEAHLQPLLALVPGLAEADAIGEGAVELRAIGGRAQLSGGLEVSDGRARVVSLGQHLRDIEGFLQLRGNRIVIDEERQLRATDPAGRLALDGEILFDGLVPSSVDLHVFPDGFPFRREGAVLASLAGHAGIRARFAADGLHGEIRTSSFEVRLPDRMAGSVMDLEARRDVLVIGEDAFELTADPGSSYPYHVRLDATEPFVVRRNDFEAQLTAELDIVYADPDLTVSGNAVLRSGTFEVFGKRFRVTRGSFLFLEEAPLDPVIDLVATYPIPGRSNASISIEVGGQLSNMQIAFTSTETNDVGQIISLLVAGSSSRSAEETAQQAGNQAANFMAGLAAGVLTLTLRRELGDIGSVVPAVSVETVGSAGTLRARAFWDASTIIPDVLREVVVGASVEGFFTSDQGTAQGGASGGSSGVGGGVTIELQFPYGISSTTTYVPPQSFGTDLLWQP